MKIVGYRKQQKDDRILTHSQVMSYDSACMLKSLGETLQNYRQIKEEDLECDKSDSFDSDKEFSQQDVDDSTKDPDWGPEKDSYNNDATYSENEDSDLEKNNLQSEKSVLEPENNIIQTDDAGLENTGHTRTKRKKKTPAEGLKHTNKKLRMEGKKYKGVLKNAYLPKLPSHYCRASSSKVYLEPVIQSISDMHREYRKEAQKDDSPVISLFHNILEELNISLFQSRKDQCDTCCGYEAGNIDKVINDQHIVKKEAVRAEKNKDKEAALTNDDMKVIRLDLQALLMCIKTSAMYYKTKLSCHNFTIFEH
ncbi:unnamed protein product [Mytilus coruscus]|uniref:Uncharacterized protein n=1 Tax=Mytilus coruscus TaxID=42192 RepID=A0A6J8DK80_MYTCO|nr:unnamed protein product [Mytilus coruscus]